MVDDNDVGKSRISSIIRPPARCAWLPRSMERQGGRRGPSEADCDELPSSRDFSPPSDFQFRMIQFGEGEALMIPTGYESCIRDLHSMMDLVLRLEATQNRDRAFNGGLVDGNRLESPFKRSIFSNGFTVFIRC